jgi:hypothetical protein
MKRLAKGFGFLAAILLAAPALGQTPATYPDVPLERTGGVYPIGCHTPLDTDLDQVCWARTDLVDGVVELGCMDGPLPDTDYRMDVAVERTPHVNAIVKCYVTDTEGLISDYSDNSGIIDFMPPGKPRIVWTHVRPAARTWPRSQERKLTFEVEELVLWTPRERQPEQIKTLALMVSD